LTLNLKFETQKKDSDYYSASILSLVKEVQTLRFIDRTERPLADLIENTEASTELRLEPLKESNPEYPFSNVLSSLLNLKFLEGDINSINLLLNISYKYHQTTEKLQILPTCLETFRLTSNDYPHSSVRPTTLFDNSIVQMFPETQLAHLINSMILPDSLTVISYKEASGRFEKVANDQTMQNKFNGCRINLRTAWIK